MTAGRLRSLAWLRYATQRADSGLRAPIEWLLLQHELIQIESACRIAAGE